MRAKDLDREVRALASAPGHVCFSLTEDLHGCRTVDKMRLGRVPVRIVCRACVEFREFRRPQSHAPLSLAVQKWANEGSIRVR